MDLQRGTKNYDWGQKAPDSLVSKLAEAGNHVSIDKGVPYAEFWMGSHPNGCSLLEENGEKLDNFLFHNSDYLGSRSVQMFGNRLPFLFKVLSVLKPLSIQIHPNKSQALELHQKNPKLYPEANHKPEMCVAVSRFFALCGFRPYMEIVDNLSELPELINLIGEDNSNNFVSNPSIETWRCCFSNLMDRSTNSFDIVKFAQNSILGRIKSNFSDRDMSTWDTFDWFQWLTLHFDGDVGCFAVFIMNIVKMEPNDCIFLDAGLAHAYLFGDCIECMAHSDMVIRAGLTSKLCDVHNLCRLVEYSPFESQKQMIIPFDGIYTPPSREFALERIMIFRGGSKNITALSSISICLVLSGSGEITNLSEIMKISKGSVFLVSAETKLLLKANNDDCCVFRAFVNLS